MNSRLTPIPAAATAPKATPRRFVCTHVRQALQHVVAIGACSPYLAATCDTRIVATAYSNILSEMKANRVHKDRLERLEDKVVWPLSQPTAPVTAATIKSSGLRIVRPSTGPP